MRGRIGEMSTCYECGALKPSLYCDKCECSVSVEWGCQSKGLYSDAVWWVKCPGPCGWETGVKDTIQQAINAWIKGPPK